MPKVFVQPFGAELDCAAGATLMEVLIGSELPLSNPCNGKGTCGKCRVRVLSEGGAASESLSAVAEQERRHLSDADRENGWRLACLARVQDDVSIELPRAERGHEVLAGGFMPDFSRDEDLQGYGLAVDIGTTTVVVGLVDLATGKELSHASSINAQKHFGLDVLTRITYEYEQGEAGIRSLQAAIVKSLNKMAAEACSKAGISTNQVSRINVAANCTMTHMLLGVDARSLGKAPYKPVFTESKTLPAAQIGLDLGPDAVLYCLPQVSAYIGADIVAGAYVCDLHHAIDNVLFIDIGTNGEIVLAANGKLWCCSCAAGPALEGMNISSGMRAAEGAIQDLTIGEEGIDFDIIGGVVEPQGLCGSGILAAIKELLRTGIVAKSGAFVKLSKLADDDWRRRYIALEEDGVKRRFVMSAQPELVVTQSDVRQVQLAKGALLSGFMALLDAAGITVDDLDRIMVAGQFGAHLKPELLVGTGILPEGTADRIVYVGNSSKTGAHIALLSKQAVEEIEEVAARMEYFELAETDDYEMLFSRCMTFPKF